MKEGKSLKRSKLTALATMLMLSLAIFYTVILYAKPDFGPNCLSCHTGGGIVVTSNATGIIEANASKAFGLEVNAEGEAGSLTMIWSQVADNPSFTFIPSQIIDNGPNDIDPAGNKAKGIFRTTAPAIPGEYTIQVFAAGSGGKGGTLTFQVTVSTEGPHMENLLPTAYFLYARRGMTIKFEDRSWDMDGNITSWHWNFGDNINSTEQNPTHTFAEPGTYTVVLTITDDRGGSNTRSQTFIVPSKAERLQLWAFQVFIGSIMIVFTIVFATGIATSRKRREKSAHTSIEGKKIE